MGRLSRAEQWYARLLRLYPPAYRRRFATEMRQTFRDLYRDYNGSPVTFWLRLSMDAAAGAGREYALTIGGLNMKKMSTLSANTSALYWGAVLLLPAALFFVASTGFAIIRPHWYIAQQLHLPLRWLQVSLVGLPAAAAAINIVPLARRVQEHREPLLSWRFVGRYVLTLTLIAVSLGWLVVLFGHDTMGCALHYLPQLKLHDFGHCARTH